MKPAIARKLGIPVPKRSKFNVDLSPFGTLARTYNGVVYDSKAEAAMAAELDLKFKAKVIVQWIRQVRVPLVVNGSTIAALVLDFKVWLPDGTVEYIEVKGFSTATWKLKEKLFRALHPDCMLLVVKAK